MKWGETIGNPQKSVDLQDSRKGHSTSPGYTTEVSEMGPAYTRYQLPDTQTICELYQINNKTIQVLTPRGRQERLLGE